MINVSWSSTPSFGKYVSMMQELAKPNNRRLATARQDMLFEVGVDHLNKMLDGVDRYGRPRAPLAASTRRKIAKGKRGAGPSLVPMRTGSRYLTKIKFLWVLSREIWRLEVWFDGFVSKKGFPIPLAHEKGVPSRNLPKRAVMGITPKGWIKVREVFFRFVEDSVK